MATLPAVNHSRRTIWLDLAGSRALTQIANRECYMQPESKDARRETRKYGLDGRGERRDPF